jgi:hypothetical protein
MTRLPLKLEEEILAGEHGMAKVSVIQRKVVRQPPTTPPAAPNLNVPGRRTGLVVVAQDALQGLGLCRRRWSPIDHRSG